MNSQKLKDFIQLIDEAIQIAEEHRKIMQTQEFYEKLKEAGWITDEDIQLGKEHLETKYTDYFSYEYLDDTLMLSLKNLRRRAENPQLEESIWKRVREELRGHRGNFGLTYGISDRGHEMWADDLYDGKIYKACWEVEHYYNHELE